MKLARPRLRYLGEVAGLSCYLVSGEQVRNELDIDFTQGGNEAVYPTYVPAGEIWIDDAMGPLDRCATCLHEIVERDEMIREGLGYDEAHDIASSRERVFRAEMAKRPPAAFDTARVEQALRDRRTEPAPRRRTARELDAEIHAAARRQK